MTHKLLLPLLLGYMLTAIPATAQWTEQIVSTEQMNAVYATSATTAFVVGNNGVARKTTNGGSTWSIMTVDATSTANITGITFVNATLGYTCGAGQEIYETVNGGSSWDNIGTGITDLYDVTAPASGTVWTCGNEEVGFGFIYNPISMALKQPPVVSGKDLRGIYFQNATTGYAVGEGGLIAKTTNSGTTWTAQTSGTTQMLNKVKFVSTNDGIAVGNAGVILRTTNGGTSWSLTTVGTQDLNAVYYGSASQVWVVGNGGTILYSSNGGSSWTTQPSGITSDLNGIGGSGTSAIWACGDGGKVLKYSGGPSAIITPAIDADEVSIYPVPASGSLTLTFPNTAAMDVRITDLAGREVANTTNLISGASINISGLVPGTYFLHCTGNGHHIIRRVTTQ